MAIAALTSSTWASAARTPSGLSTAPGYPPDILAGIAERTAKMNIGPLFWCPTIEGFLNYQSLIENPESLDDPAWQLDVPNDIVQDIKASIKHPGQLGYYQITPLRAAPLNIPSEIAR